jgi:hypothetical protein
MGGTGGLVMVQELGYDVGLVVLGPVSGVWYQGKRRMVEQTGNLGRQSRSQVAVVGSEDYGDRDSQPAESSVTYERVVLVEGFQEAGGPSADGWKGVGLVGVAEELGEDRPDGHAVGVEGVQAPVVGGVLEEPQSLGVVAHHGVGGGVRVGSARRRIISGSCNEGWCPKIVLSRTRRVTRSGWVMA